MATPRRVKRQKTDAELDRELEGALVDRFVEDADGTLRPAPSTPPSGKPPAPSSSN